MELSRQPLPIKIEIKGDHGDDIYRAYLVINRTLENHYASINARVVDAGYIIDCYPFAVND